MSVPLNLFRLFSLGVSMSFSDYLFATCKLTFLKRGMLFVATREKRRGAT